MKVIKELKMTPVENTKFQNFFKNISKGSVYVLDENESASTWKAFVKSDRSSYFRLSDDNWVINSETIKVLNWIDAYNEDDNEKLSEQLRNSVDWDVDEGVRIYISKLIVLETVWDVFLKYWDDFIAFEDDAFILGATSSSENNIFLFMSSGIIHLK